LLAGHEGLLYGNGGLNRSLHVLSGLDLHRSAHFLGGISRSIQVGFVNGLLNHDLGGLRAFHEGLLDSGLGHDLLRADFLVFHVSL
jgi:hypothetical protein